MIDTFPNGTYKQEKGYTDMRNKNIKVRRNNNKSKTVNKNKFNIRKLKYKLKENKIYFETLVMVFLTGMSITVAISSNRIANSQLELDKIQTNISIAEQAPFLIFNGITPDEYGSRYSFVNKGGKIFNPSIYITDDIFILVTKANSQDIHIENFNGTNLKGFRIIDIVVNQRYSYPRVMYDKDTALFCISEQKDSEPINKIINEINKSLKVDSNIRCSFSTGKRVLFKYTDYRGQAQTEKYSLLNKNTQLIKDGSDENPFNRFRGNEVNYDINPGDKKKMLEDIRKQIDELKKE